MLVRALLERTVAAEVKEQRVPRIGRLQQARERGEDVSGGRLYGGFIRYHGQVRVPVRAQQGLHGGNVVQAPVELVARSGVIAAAEHGALFWGVKFLELLREGGVVGLGDDELVGGQKTARGALVLLQFFQFGLHLFLYFILF